jgi:hypothetical protein
MIIILAQRNFLFFSEARGDMRSEESRNIALSCQFQAWEEVQDD